MVRAVIVWFTAWLVWRVFGFAPEEHSRLRIRLAQTQTEREQLRYDFRETKAQLSTAHETIEETKKIRDRAVATACRYRNALKMITEAKTHSRAVLLAKTAVKS